MGHHHICFWQYGRSFEQIYYIRLEVTGVTFGNNILWHANPKTRAKVDEYNKGTMAIMHNGQDEADWVDYQNCTRVTPTQYRYKATERLARLKELK